MMRAHMRRAARNFATSWKTLLWQLKKNASRGANSSTSRPAAIAACTYAMPLDSVKATSWTAEEPFSRKWYPEIETVFQLGIRARQYANRSVVSRIEDSGG